MDNPDPKIFFSSRILAEFWDYNFGSLFNFTFNFTFIKRSKYDNRLYFFLMKHPYNYSLSEMRSDSDNW